MARDSDKARPRRMTRRELEEGQAEMRRRISGSTPVSEHAQTIALAHQLKIQLLGALETRKELWNSLMDTGSGNDEVVDSVFVSLREIASKLRFCADLATGIDITLREGGR